MSKLFIGPYKTGLQLNLEPWLINQEAFVDLFNAYVWRGRIKKKQGTILLSRLQKLGSTIPNALGNTIAPHTSFTGTLAAGNLPVSPGSVVIAVGALTFTDNGNGTLTSPAVNSNYGTIDYETGVINLFFDPALGGPTAVNVTAVSVLPKLPVMSISTREEDPINQEQTIAFDTDFSYQFNQGSQLFEDVSFYKMTAPANPVVWTGTNSDFFWTTNYYRINSRNIFWATNNIAGNHNKQISDIADDGGFVQFTLAAGHGYIVNDVVYLDEISLAAASGYNGLTGTVTAVAATTITLSIAFIAGSNGASGGYVFGLSRTINGDGIRFYDGFGGGLGWTNFAPPLQTYNKVAGSAINYLFGALILIPYKNRLLAFNTTEGPVGGLGSNFKNRVRWCQNGTPFYANSSTPPVAGEQRPGISWVDDTVGKGGYIDAPTTEAIVSIALYKDTCIVFFERSTWQLRYTGNEILPFVWERINEQMGAESTFSPIYFDEGVLAVGDKGIVTANSTNVERIDEYIPDLVYQIHNDSAGVTRVHGIRDFQKKICYWTYPDQGTGTIFPDRLLTYNYEDKCYSIFDNSHTCFGNLQSTDSIIWDSPYLWSSDLTWDSGKSQSYYPNIVAGNQVGFVHYFDKDPVVNDISMDLTGITNASPPVVTVNNHNLKTNQYVRILNTTAFGVAVVGESPRPNPLLTPPLLPPTIIPAGSTSFSGSLINTGLFPATLVATVGADVFIDLGNGTLSGGTGGSTVDYDSSTFVVNFAALAVDTAITVDYTYNDLNFRVFQITRVNANTFSLNDQDFSSFGAPYLGSGNIQVIDNFRIKSKIINPFLQEDLEARINYLNAYLTTDALNFKLNTYADDNSTLVIDSLTASNTNYYGFVSDKTWNRIYPNVTSSFFQLEFTLDDAQIKDYFNVNHNFELHALIIDVNKGARLR